MNAQAAPRMASRTQKSASVSKQDIVQVAAQLLAEGGREALTSRAVVAAAGVQVPTIYRQFGDMRGLLNEVATYGFAEYLRLKAAGTLGSDPVENLRQGWDLHVQFGLDHPAIYTLIYGDPDPEAPFTAAVQAQAVLHGLVQAIAEAGRLRVDVTCAAQMVHAAGCGTTLTLLALKPEQRDLTCPALTRDAVLAAITTPPNESAAAQQGQVANRAVTLKAALPEATMLTPGERTLLGEWLDKLSRAEK
ncbi:TetR/AcrR family transcriptional regulator [Deinococcus sp.]|uniref:TetR/AcrR family transcriptional regulator n=1 Tax=Deinococcus sp. TaxID=47478 RepID=UPI003B5BF9D2